MPSTRLLVLLFSAAPSSSVNIETVRCPVHFYKACMGHHWALGNMRLLLNEKFFPLHSTWEGWYLADVLGDSNGGISSGRVSCSWLSLKIFFPGGLWVFSLILWVCHFSPRWADTSQTWRGLWRSLILPVPFFCASYSGSQLSSVLIVGSFDFSLQKV